MLSYVFLRVFFEGVFLDTCFFGNFLLLLAKDSATTTCEYNSTENNTHTHTHYVARRRRRRRRRSNARKKRGGQKALPGTPPRARDSLPAMRKRWTRLWSIRRVDSNKNATDKKEIQKRIRDGEEARDFFDDERVARKDERERKF